MVGAGEEEGAKLVVDGRQVQPEGGEDGFWLGPTLVDHVEPAMSGYTDESFGPARAVLGGGGRGAGPGPPLVDHVEPAMSVYTDEIFGPVLSVLRVDTYEHAVELINGNEHGNGTGIFTNDGREGRRLPPRAE